MSSGSDGPRRDSNCPDANPFIAFRRFADSQFSTLFNMVLTLPPTLAQQPSSADRAHAQCLFGPPDPERCNKLYELKGNAGDVLNEAIELLRAGNAHAYEEKRRELIKIKKETDDLGREILEAAEIAHAHPFSGITRQEKDIVEKAANKKGQEWAWSWGWGFPAPFDAKEDEDFHERNGMSLRNRWSSGTKEDNHMEERRARCRRRFRQTRDEGDDQVPELRPLRGLFSWRDQRMVDVSEDHDHEERMSECGRRWRRSRREEKRTEDGNPDDRSGGTTYPKRNPIGLPADDNGDEHQGERPRSLFDELGNLIVDEVTRMMHPKPFAVSNNRYSPRALEDNEQLKNAGVSWRDAFEDLVRAERGATLIPPENLGRSNAIPYNQWIRRFWDPSFASQEPGTLKAPPFKRVPWEGEETSKEPSYEYSHDHEDQHDDPPTPRPTQGKFIKGMPATELDAYERMLNTSHSPVENAMASRPSVLSTLTTTERTVSPDGTVTTKVVMKKKFSDGSEQTTHNVRTQLGSEFGAQGKYAQDVQSVGKPVPDKKSGSGWFWSS